MNCQKMSSKDYSITDIIVHDNEIWSGYHKHYTPLINEPKPIIFKIIYKVKIIVDVFSKILKLDEV